MFTVRNGHGDASLHPKEQICSFRQNPLLTTISSSSSSYFSYFKLSPELKDLLIGLLKKDPRERLGSGGADEIKNHKWFKNVNFSHVYNKLIKPPYIPMVHSEEDVSNFSK